MARAMVDEDGDSWSDFGDDWEERLPLSTYRVLNGADNIDGQGIRQELDEDDPGQEDLLDPAPEREMVLNWTDMVKNMKKHPPLPPFDDEDTGIAPQLGLHPQKSIVDFFRVFFTLEFIHNIVTATNSYAEAVRTAYPNKHRGKWEPVTIQDISKFIGLTFLMGLLKKPALGDYWTVTKETATPFFTTVFRRDRFFAILR